MNKLLIALVLFLSISTSLSAQTHYKQDGTPDMRYKENKQTYGNSYSTPSYSTPTYSQPTYSQPTYSQPTYTQPTYTQPTYSQPTYSQPTYSNPNTGTQSSYPSYPTKQDGTPDMRYKENKSLYGY